MTALTPALAPLLIATLSLANLSATLRAQMEKRDGDLYDKAAFLAAAPAQGSPAPDLVLADLDGRLHALSSYRGRVLVLIKGGFT